MVRLERYICRLFSAIFNRRFAAGRQNMLFLVGHMRSGSTLLLHLLVAHQGIIGFGETHYDYSGPEDFGAVACRIYRSFRRLRWSEKYIVDKVLHSEHNVTPALARSGNTRTILLAREPAATIPSILRVSNLIRSEEQALHYYVERLEVLQQFAVALGPEPCFLVTYDTLVNDSETVLQQLHSFLELPPPPLRPQYETMWSTGKAYIGDPSETIKTGHIVKKAQTNEHALSGSALQQARAAYEKCLEVCRAHLGSAREIS